MLWTGEGGLDCVYLLHAYRMTTVVAETLKRDNNDAEEFKLASVRVKQVKIKASLLA